MKSEFSQLSGAPDEVIATDKRHNIAKAGQRKKNDLISTFAYKFHFILLEDHIRKFGPRVPFESYSMTDEQIHHYCKERFKKAITNH